MDFLQEGLERLWEGQVELKWVQVEIKDQLQKNQVMVTMDDIADEVHEEVLHIYFNEGGARPGQEPEGQVHHESWRSRKSVLLESVKKYIQANFVPGVHSFIVDFVGSG